MNSKVDKIVGTFVKAVNKLEAESLRLSGVAQSDADKAAAFSDSAAFNAEEAGRASRIAAKLSELVI